MTDVYYEYHGQVEYLDSPVNILEKILEKRNQKNNISVEESLEKEIAITNRFLDEVYPAGIDCQK